MEKMILIYAICFIFIGITLLLLNKLGYLVHITNYLVSFYNHNGFVVFAILLNVAIMALFSLLGYKMAVRKNRNPMYWAFLCCIFHVWAYLILYFMKPIEKLGGLAVTKKL